MPAARCQGAERVQVRLGHRWMAYPVSSSTSIGRRAQRLTRSFKYCHVCQDSRGGGPQSEHLEGQTWVQPLRGLPRAPVWLDSRTSLFPRRTRPGCCLRSGWGDSASLAVDPGDLLVAARAVDVDHPSLDISVSILIQTWRSAVATPGPVLPVELFDNEAGCRLLGASD